MLRFPQPTAGLHVPTKPSRLDWEGGRPRIEYYPEFVVMPEKFGERDKLSLRVNVGSGVVDGPR